VTTVVSRPWVRGALLVVVVLVALSPLFGWASAAVGYAEPLENAAEATGADASATASPSVFAGYTLPGLAGPAGTLAAAAVGAALTLVVALGLGRLLERGR
jgi:cobalt/nickel transport protein